MFRTNKNEMMFIWWQDAFKISRFSNFFEILTSLLFLTAEKKTYICHARCGKPQNRKIQDKTQKVKTIKQKHKALYYDALGRGTE